MSYRRRFLQGKKDTLIRALKFTAMGQNSTIGYTSYGGTPTLEYSIDGKQWESWDYSTIDIISGESIYIRGNNPSGLHLNSSSGGNFTITGAVNCKGSIMYLLDYTQELLVIPNAYCFSNLFFGCTGLITAPTLPATVLKGNCYDSMFEGCINLAVAPELPATVLADNCYSHMFQNCTGLTEAPELLATTLVYGCYKQMFMLCSRLSSVTMLATNVSAPKALSSWLYSVGSAGTFTKKQGVQIPSGSNGIPSKWTVVEV